MAKRQKIIMAWSKCTIEIAPTGADDAFNGTELKSIGVIKDKSTTLEPSDGDALEMKATGGETVAKEVQEGGFTLKTRVIEPDELYSTLKRRRTRYQSTSFLYCFQAGLLRRGR